MKNIAILEQVENSLGKMYTELESISTDKLNSINRDVSSFRTTIKNYDYKTYKKELAEILPRLGQETKSKLESLYGVTFPVPWPTTITHAVSCYVFGLTHYRNC